MKLQAKDGTTVVLTHHARERMAERGIDLAMVKHAIDTGKLKVSTKGKPQWVAKIDGGRSRIHLALDVRGSKVIVPTLWVRGRLDTGVL
jgi:molybdopterin-guanine dinucleotide biosynthesis protein